MKKALITGITGQDGSYLTELLLSKGYEVHGTVKQGKEKKKEAFWRIAHVLDQITIHSCDVNNCGDVEIVFQLVMPDEVFHLASRVDARVLPDDEENVFRTNFFGTYYLLRTIKKYKEGCKLYCAGSSLMFGITDISPQNEKTPMNPTTPYGIAKTTAFHFVNMYRKTYGMFVCTGILFNHESPRRDEYFLPRKITASVARIKTGRQKKLILGNINTKRDWGYAGDVVKSMWLMLQQNKLEDYVIGTGELHSVKELLEIAFGYVGLKWDEYVVIDKSLVRKVDYTNLCADITKAKEKLKWKPKMSFQELIETMTAHDLKLIT